MNTLFYALVVLDTSDYEQPSSYSWNPGNEDGEFGVSVWYELETKALYSPEGSPIEREYNRRAEYIKRAVDNLMPETSRTWFDNYPEQSLSLFTGNDTKTICSGTIRRDLGERRTAVVESSKRRGR